MLPYWFEAVKKKKKKKGGEGCFSSLSTAMHVCSFMSKFLQPDCSPPGFSVHGIPGKNTGVGCHALLRDLPSPWGWLNKFQGYRALSLRSRKQVSAFTRSGFSLLSKDSCVIGGAAAVRETHDSFCQAQIGSESGVFSTWGMATCPAPWLITPPSGLPAAGCWTLG